MELYLAPRAKKKVLNIEYKLEKEEEPDLRNLRPFPDKINYQLDLGLAHVSSVSIHPSNSLVAVAD